MREDRGGVTLRVRVKPRASRDALDGERGGALVVRVAAPPVEGRANEALARVLARALRVGVGAVAVIRGAGGRDKLVRIAGVTSEAVRALGDEPPSPREP